MLVQKILSSRCLFWLVPVILVLPFILCINTDSYYMIATGKYIVEHGVPKTNPFLVVDGMDIAIQNWLYCVLHYYCSRGIGLIGVQLFSVAQYILFSYTCFQLLHALGHTNMEAGAFTCLSDICMAHVMKSARPALLTFIWLLLIIYELEQDRNCGSQMVLAVLPVASIFTANVQSSNLMFLFCPIIAFMAAWVADGFKKRSTNTHILLPWISTVAAGSLAFVNPYKTGNVFYLFQSLGHVEAPELQPLSFGTWDAPFLVFGMIIVFTTFLIMCVSPEIDYYRLFLLVGFGFLAFTCKRNIIFLIPAVMLVWDEVCRTASRVANQIKDKWPQNIQTIQKTHQMAKLALIFAIVFLGFFWEIKLTENIFLTGNIREQVYAMKNDGDLLRYFDNHDIDLGGMAIWPGNPALEMFGAKVLLEPRLEVSDSAINHQADLYTEFKQVIGSYRQEQIDDYFNRYQFDYFLVDKGSKMDLYFQTHSSYLICMETDEIVLYRNAE